MNKIKLDSVAASFTQQRNQGSISVSGQLPTFSSQTQQQSTDNKLGLMLG